MAGSPFSYLLRHVVIYDGDGMRIRNTYGFNFFCAFVGLREVPKEVWSAADLGPLLLWSVARWYVLGDGEKS